MRPRARDADSSPLAMTWVRRCKLGCGTIAHRIDSSRSADSWDASFPRERDFSVHNYQLAVSPFDGAHLDRGF